MIGLSQLNERLAALTPEQRELLLKQLKKNNFDISKLPKQEQAIQPRGHSNPSPLSVDQERIWFFNQVNPFDPAYNVYSAIRIKGMLNVPIMEQSVNEIIRRHEAWRTTFDMIDGQPMQIVAEDYQIAIDLVDLRGVAVEEREEQAQKMLSHEVQVPFDLRNGPLLRVKMLQLADDEHLMVINVHHIVVDRMTFNIVFHELMTHYQAFLTGQPSRLPSMQIHYADYSEWQRNHLLQGETRDKLITYWKHALDGSDFVLNLPTDHPRPAVQNFKGARTFFYVTKDMMEAIKTLGSHDGSSPFMILLAAFKVLLYRYTGQEDIVIGTPVTNRNRTETERVVGFFLTSSIIRTQAQGELTFVEYLKRVREATLGAFSHQDMPFGMLLDEVKPSRDMSRHPIFQAMFVYVDSVEDKLALPGLVLDYENVDGETAKCDILLGMTETDDGYLGILEYISDLFDKETIERMGQHYQTILSAIVANPGQRISDLPLMTETERQQLLVEWNDTKTEVNDDLCIHQLFERQAAKTPDEVAVVCEDQHLTYAELNRRANQVAHQLRSMGVGPEAPVGVCVERGPNLIVGLLGVLKAGGAYVPIDPSYPKERISFILEDARGPVIVTQEHVRAQLPEHGAGVLCLDADWEEIAKQPEANPDSGVQVDHMAYVIYTSGSTGKPKGVIVEHRNVLNFFVGMDERVGMKEGDALLAVTSYAFDISVLELFWTITRGVKVVILSEHSDAAFTLQEQVEQHGITMMQGTPSFLKMLLTNKATMNALKSLRVLLLGGEALPTSLAKRLKEELPARLLNMYGPTETTIWSASYEIDQVGYQVPIGRPIANTEFYLLDRNGQPVPIGVPGELYIGGAGVTRGYLGRPELTAERFVANHFSEKSGDRLYKTGDLVRYLPDGNLEFIERLDNQVKIRGFRIELGEIESVLGGHPEVLEHAVVAQPDAQGEMRLVGYVVLESGHELKPAELRNFLKEQLPEYMVPTIFVALERLPLTPNGKLDRNALPVPDGESAEEHVAPRTAVEAVLTKIWCDLLGFERVSIHSNFFEVGGHSLLVMQMVSRVRDTFKTEMPLYRLFQSSTIAGLAQVLVQYESTPGQMETIARLRQKIDSMSEDEVRAMLEAKKKAGV